MEVSWLSRPEGGDSGRNRLMLAHTTSGVTHELNILCFRVSCTRWPGLLKSSWFTALLWKSKRWWCCGWFSVLVFLCHLRRCGGPDPSDDDLPSSQTLLLHVGLSLGAHLGSFWSCWVWLTLTSAELLLLFCLFPFQSSLFHWYVGLPLGGTCNAEACPTMMVPPLHHWVSAAWGDHLDVCLQEPSSCTLMITGPSSYSSLSGCWASGETPWISSFKLPNVFQCSSRARLTVMSWLSQQAVQFDWKQTGSEGKRKKSHTSELLQWLDLSMTICWISDLLDLWPAGSLHSNSSSCCGESDPAPSSEPVLMVFWTCSLFWHLVRVESEFPFGHFRCFIDWVWKSRFNGSFTNVWPVKW